MLLHGATWSMCSRMAQAASPTHYRVTVCTGRATVAVGVTRRREGTLGVARPAPFAAHDGRFG